jgi:hypothetical protein
MTKNERNAINRILSWSNRDNYFDDVYRTLVQTGTAYVCRDDVFELNQRLNQLGIPQDSLTVCSSYGGYFLTLNSRSRVPSAFNCF